MISLHNPQRAALEGCVSLKLDRIKYIRGVGSSEVVGTEERCRYFKIPMEARAYLEITDEQRPRLKT